MDNYNRKIELEQLIYGIDSDINTLKTQIRTLNAKKEQYFKELLEINDNKLENLYLVEGILEDDNKEYYSVAAFSESEAREIISHHLKYIIKIELYIVGYGMSFVCEKCRVKMDQMSKWCMDDSSGEEYECPICGEKDGVEW